MYHKIEFQVERNPLRPPSKSLPPLEAEFRLQFKQRVPITQEHIS
jgi:hypothetical protein